MEFIWAGIGIFVLFVTFRVWGMRGKVKAQFSSEMEKRVK